MSAHCQKNTSRLIRLLSGSLRPRAAERLREHLARCPGCANAFGRLQRTAELCRNIGSEPPPELPWRRIEAQVSWRLGQEEAAAAGKKLGWLPAMAALAGALALGAFIGLLLGRGSTLPSSGPTAGSLVATDPAPVPPSPLPDEELAAVVTLAQGEVSVISSRGQAHPLVPSRPLLQGERVLTSVGRVALQWEAETGVLVTEESEAELRRLRVLEQELGLWRGAITAQVSRRREGQRFSVLADGVRVQVMGTFFAVALEEETVDIEVHEGKVRVESVDGRFPPLEVPAGMAVRVPRRGEDRRPALARTTGGARPSQLNLLAWPSFQRVMAGTGLLTVESQPSGADVVFDARAVGTTNLTLRGGVGRHLLELWRGGKLLRRQWVEIQVSPGRLALDITPRSRPAPRLPLAIQEVFRSRAVQIQACYERSLKNNPSLEGSLTLRLEVDTTGQVARASLDTDTLPDPRVGQCALTTVRRWRFPAGAETELVYPFKFRPR